MSRLEGGPSPDKLLQRWAELPLGLPSIARPGGVISPRPRACGKTANIVGSFFAGTAGFIFERTSVMAIATNPAISFIRNNDRQAHSHPVLFLKTSSSDVIFAMSTMIGRMHFSFPLAIHCNRPCQIAPAICYRSRSTFRRLAMRNLELCGATQFQLSRSLF